MAQARRPKIGVTGPDKGGFAAWAFTSISIWIAGGKAVRITPSNPRDIEGLQGLIIGGGADVNPQTYQQENFFESYLDETINNKRRSFGSKIASFLKFLIYPVIFLVRKVFSRKQGLLDKDRDELEFNLVDQAVKAEIPLLGICRGAQLINVYFKGDLYDDISSFYQEEPNRASIFPVKKVFLKARSKLARYVEMDELYVNALHRQAVKNVGEGIQVVAQEPNGVVQAIESFRENFIIGVQWHPEYLLTRASHRRIFKALVERAKVPYTSYTEMELPSVST